ncbi:PAS domain-containing protein [Bradyrhizobium sp.]|uniref:hybrid sensor histidine kinase/response regulator n=1 Tax=Bradyrhizobium sp. TaxID=376 RepID=UPI003C4C991C
MDETVDRSLQFMAGGGKVGALMRSHDWTHSPLGPPATWPQSLRSVVGLILESRFPMFVAWGRALSFLYNDAYAEILGEKHPRALGGRFQEIWTEIWPDISPLIAAALAGEATYREDLPLLMNRRGFDEQTWFTFSYSPVRDEGGAVAGMFCAVAETTQKIVAEKALRDSEEALRALNATLERRVADAVAERNVLADIVERTDIIVIVADLGYRLLGINKAGQDAFEAIYGVRPEVGNDLPSLLADKPAHLSQIRSYWDRALAGEPFTAIDEFGEEALSRRSFEVRFSPLFGPGGRQIAAYQFAQDITDRLREQARLQQAEDALRRAQKLESLGQLTGGVAHDFNNLLAIMSAGVQLLGRPGDPAQRARIMTGMRQAVKRGAALTRHLLSFSRQRPLNPEAVDLARQIDNMREILARSLRGDIHVEMQFAIDLWPVEVDIGEFELALINLCVNARDAIAGEGTIGITACNRPGFSQAGLTGDVVELAVSDSGAGIPTDMLSRVFDPFFTTKEVGKGSGLGLAQVYGFVKQSGGQVDIQSELGNGTTVRLFLPRTDRSPSLSHAQSESLVADVDGLFEGHVLLVEDDDEVAALAAEMLRLIGFGVTRVASAAAALGALANGRPVSLIFSDIMMPGSMSGVELVREIRKRRPELPVVLATGYQEAAAGAAKDGIGVLLKPYTLEELASAIGSQLSGRKD